MTTAIDTTPAVVVGLCHHGLGICRSLGRRQIPVYAIESNLSLPGCRTKYAEVCRVRDVNGPELIDDLVELAGVFDRKPVLFLTNDNMVRTVAESFEAIRSRYVINWSEPELVLKLMDKQYVQSFATACGLRYPKSFLIGNLEDLDSILDQLVYPVALKPTEPLSPFKAFRIETEHDLRRRVGAYEDVVGQFLIQEWIPGTERSIYFVNFFFGADHLPVARFVGRKVRSAPRLTGGASSAEPADRDDIGNKAELFFKDLKVRGPAALEIKESDSGEHIVIEPTVGRFDYYIETCVCNGLDMPYLAYSYQTGGDYTEADRRDCVKKKRVWVDHERDFPVYLESFRNRKERADAFRFLFKKKRYACWSWDDMKPSLYAWPRSFLALVKKVLLKLKRRALGTENH